MKFDPLAIASLAALGVVAAGCDNKQPAPPPDTPAQVADQQKAGKDAAAADAIAQAQALYNEAKDLIGKGDLKNAKPDVDQLTSMRPRLPAEWQAKVDEVTKAFAAKGK